MKKIRNTTGRICDPLRSQSKVDLIEEPNDELKFKLAKSMSLQVVQNNNSDNNNNINPEHQLSPTPQILNENYQILYENLYKEGEAFSKADIFIYVMIDFECVYKVVPFRIDTFQHFESEYFNKILTIKEKSVFKSPSHHAMLDKITNELWIPEVEPEMVCCALGNMSREDYQFEKFNDTQAIDLYKIYDYLGVEKYKEIAEARVKTQINEDNFMKIMRLSSDFEPTCAGYVKELANKVRLVENKLEDSEACVIANQMEAEHHEEQFTNLKEMVTKNWTVISCDNCKRYYSINRFEINNQSVDKIKCPYAPCDPVLGQWCTKNRAKLDSDWRSVFGQDSVSRFASSKSKNCTIM